VTLKLKKKKKNFVKNATCYKTVDSARLCPFFPEGAGLHSQFCWSTIRFEVSPDFHVFLKIVDGKYVQFQCRLKKNIYQKPAEQSVCAWNKCSGISNSVHPVVLQFSDKL
jgi:hypothetical protein